MAVGLISCPGCGQKVSAQAAACPSCGQPIAVRDGARVTTQQTGKGWKAAQLTGAAMMLAGLVGCMATMGGDASGALWGLPLFLLGALVWIGARLGAWWHHG